MIAKPQSIRVIDANIPTALIAERRWCLWRYEWKERDGKAGRWTKPPYQTSGHAAKPNDPATWTAFEHALRAYRAGHFDGLGFCLGDGWSGIDLDHCLDDSGVVIPDATGPVGRLSCYIEVSPSGTGCKAIGRADQIGGEVNFATGAFTTWQNARFFAITGRTRGAGLPTVDISDVIAEWFPARTFGPAIGPVPAYMRLGDTRGTAQIERLTDDEVVSRILTSPQADKFLRLVRGDTSGYGGDHSRADQALVSILAYWCQGDLAQVDRLFRQSGLMRDKWNSGSYRRATLARAVPR